MNLRTFRIGGVHPEENKITAEMATQIAPLPKQAIFPLGQHIGAPAKPVVAKGDKVKVGTLIAEAGGFVSAPIYSSVSGTVFKVDTSIDATGYRKPCIIINVEGDEWEESIDRSDKLETLEAHAELTPEEIVNRIKVAGVTGMGGAGFPTFIKLCPPPGAKAECVIINGVECEPYITADYRLMMEHADEILVGLNLLMKAAKVEKGYIGIEDNKPAAIKLFEEKTAGDSRIEIVPLAKKYPQGGEKQLVDAVIRRQVPAPPAIPVNVGAIVQNVGTAFAVYQAVMKNKPLFECYTTVTGKQVKNPGNFLVRMGTPFSQMIENCGGLPEGDNKVLAGGPMMGKAVISLDVPVTKGTNSITVLTDADAHRKKAQPLIVSLSPHAHENESVEKNMYGVIIALVPAILASIYFFGLGSAVVLLTSVAACVFFEWAITKYLLKEETSLLDGSAIITGLLLGMNLPSNLPLWIIIIGALFAIGVGKMTFGGLGNNPFNPALVGRCFLLVSFPAQMTSWPVAGQMLSYTDATTGATPLAIMKTAIKTGDASLLNQLPDSLSLLFGATGDTFGAGTTGEVCAVALLLGLAYMLWKKVITWHIPVSIIATVFVFSGLMHLANPVYANPFAVILSGGLMLGAIFMATDYVTSPMTHKGMLIYGVCIGLLTIIIRNWGSYPEGMSFAILIMNAFTPLINTYVKPKRFGEKPTKK